MQDEWGITPLVAACYNGYVNTAKILVENGALVDLPNKVIYGIICCLAEKFGKQLNLAVLQIDRHTGKLNSANHD